MKILISVTIPTLDSYLVLILREPADSKLQYKIMTSNRHLLQVFSETPIQSKSSYSI